jgi:hypothetical protein
VLEPFLLGMTFEERIQALGQEAVACNRGQEAVDVTRRIQMLMHGRIGQVRAKLETL